MALNAMQTDLLLRAATALRNAGNAALADEVNEILLASAAAKASAARSRAAGATGRPPAIYHVGLQPGWHATVHGARAATTLVAQTLMEHGQRNPPSQGSLAVSLSRNGTWQRIFETANGTLALTVRRVNPPSGHVPADAPSVDDQ